MKQTRIIKPLSEQKFLKSDAVQKLLGYGDKMAFWAAVHAAKIPYIKINSRRIIFDEDAVSAWLDSHSVGGVR